MTSIALDLLLSGAKTAIGEFAKRASASKASVTLDCSAAESNLRTHLAFVAQWSGVISFKELSKPKHREEIYVEPYLDVVQGDIAAFYSNNPRRALSITDLLRTRDHKLLLGEVGSGKTTALKHLVSKVLPAGTSPDWFPVLVRLARIPKTDKRQRPKLDCLVDFLLAELGIAMRFTGDISESYQRQHKLRYLADFLDRLPVLLMLDGLDEVALESRRLILQEVEMLIEHLTRATIILTCRRADFTFQVSRAVVFSIQPLSRKQSDLIAQRWLGPSGATQFVAQLRRAPFDGAEKRPLTLVHLLAYYERKGSLPERPRTVYRKLISLYLEEWDQQNLVVRKSQYAGFEPDTKAEFLRAIAFALTMDGARGSFSHSQLSRAYRSVADRYNLPEGQAQQVAREIESHTGIIQSDDSEQFSFTHLSLQEFLTAEYMSTLRQIDAFFIAHHPHEAAVMVALASEPDAVLAEVTSSLLECGADDRDAFMPAFASRLLLERPDWIGSKLAAFSLLALHATMRPHAQQERSRDGYNSFYDVGRQHADKTAPTLALLSAFPSLKRATTDLLATSVIEYTGDEYCLVRTPRFFLWPRPVPAYLRDWMTGENGSLQIHVDVLAACGVARSPEQS